MSAHYTFLPWSRQGLANRITAPAPAGSLRTTVEVKLALTGHGVDGVAITREFPRNVQLVGPGDVVGIDSRSIVRTEPRDWVTNFEPNYLAAVEFYDEDFPWRYTPAPPDASGARLSPWLVLAVLAEDEFASAAVPDRPLPAVILTDAALAGALPDPATMWAWAHVHVNRSLTANEGEVVATDRDAVAARLDATVRENADLAYSRIVCPRRLEANKTYHAMLLPAYETGRLAGLGLEPNTAPSATACAWTSGGASKNEFPVYFRWQFRTGALGDFEYLVRLLQPRPVDKRVGSRPMDVQKPGMNLPGITDPRFRGELMLGGALRVPRSSLSAADRAEIEAQEHWPDPAPHPFQRKLGALINLADDYAAQTAAQANSNPDAGGLTFGPDPVITPPLYGRWHAMAARVLKERDGTPVSQPQNWLHELNLDPRFRVPAGLGTRVVQARQEDLMAAAWDQLGDVLAANQRLRRLRFSQQVAFVWHRSHLQVLATVNPATALALTAPVQARIMSGTKTMRAHVGASKVPPVLLAPTFRRLVRPRGRLMRALPFDAARPAKALIDRVNQGEVETAPPKITPPGGVSVGDVVDGAMPDNVPGSLADLLLRAPWIVYLPLLLALIIALIVWMLGTGLPVAVVIVAVGAALTWFLRRTLRAVRAAHALDENVETPAIVADLPASPDFVLTLEPDAASAATTLTRSGTDNVVAARFKQALADQSIMVRANATADRVGENGPVRAALDIRGAVRTTLQAIDPALTIARLAAQQIRIPARIAAEQPEPFVEAMAYPVFDLPMYAPLRDLSAELLIPNVNLIENNTVTLLETNQKFIEAYMVGLNHEFARELLWREYPTDQRGSSFRQFWDVSSFFAGAAADDTSLREQLRDIPPLHRWPAASKLGDHDARERPGDAEEEIVLVIRGELLKRYPTAVIYAQAAEWERLPNGDIDRVKERKLVELTTAEEADPPRSKIRTPLYEAKLEPDIYFFGFDLTVPAGRGGSGEQPADSAGWFFVIKERPGEPRFGFDETSDARIIVYNDLGWDRVPMQGQFIRAVGAPVPGIPNASPPGQAEKEAQRAEDMRVRWDDSASAAEIAYVMYQAPVMVAIHAAEMLPSS
jgi:hypothetical protein